MSQEYCVKIKVAQLRLPVALTESLHSRSHGELTQSRLLHLTLTHTYISFLNKSCFSLFPF